MECEQETVQGFMENQYKDKLDLKKCSVQYEN